VDERLLGKARTFDERRNSQCDQLISRCGKPLQHGRLALLPGTRQAFSRHSGIYRPMWLNCKPSPGAEADCLPLVGPESQIEEHAGRNTLLLIVPMSSDRLSLDRVGRHHCSSPFRRHGQINMHSQQSGRKGDISTLHRLVTFQLCVDT
jgi:hypothetical protein